MRISLPNHPDAEKLRLLFQHLRGSAVPAFAEAEFAMGDFLGAVDELGIYKEQQFSIRVEGRLKKFEKICLSFAGDNEIKGRVEWAMSGFKLVIDDRNALVHGSAKLFPDLKIVEVSKIAPRGGNNRAILKMTYDLDTMADSVREFDEISRNIIGISWLLAQHLDLTPNSIPFSLEITNSSKG